MKRRYTAKIVLEKYFHLDLETEEFADEDGEILDWDLFEHLVFQEALRRGFTLEDAIEVDTWIGELS